MDSTGDAKMEANIWFETELIREGNPSTYSIKYRSINVVRKETKIRKCDIGTPNSQYLTEKVIMFVGETGTGKTTMINRVVNYLLGVQWEDNKRFKLIPDNDEETAGEESQTESKTKWISSYTFNQTKTSADKVTLIDTPGFGDTGGRERDEFITSQIKEFVGTKGPSGIDHIDAVAFVLIASEKRLTATQKYIFDSVLHLFGKDISDNIFLFITHADVGNIQDGQAPVIEAVKKGNVPFVSFKMFNNDILYRDKSSTSGRRASSSSHNKDLWNWGGEDLDKFFKELDKRKPKSISLSAEVLAERASLEMVVKALPHRIRTCLVQVSRIDQEGKVLQKYSKEMEENEDFTYTVKEEVNEKKTLGDGDIATVCTKCMFNCHLPCRVLTPKKCLSFDAWACLERKILDTDFWRRLAEGSSGTEDACFICPGYCSTSDHKSVSYKFETSIKTCIKTKRDIKERYDVARDLKHRTEHMLNKIKQKLECEQKSVQDLMEMLRKSLERLDEIALKSDVLSVEEYLANLIAKERLKGEPGWEGRVKELTLLLEREASNTPNN